MKKKRSLFLTLLPPLLLAAALGLGQQTPPGDSDPQETDPARRPATDYMRSLLSQNTKPLGVKVDKSLQRLMRQPTITWAARSSRRHILD
ncbi:MAG: hypothetical protein ACYDH3_04010 [Candidatus Aminicenantales bacterium]